MYILNEKKDIYNEVYDKINNYDELFIAVSFITEKGFKILFDDSKINSKVHIITTTEEYITQPSILRKFINKGCQVKIISPKVGRRSFHSKFIISRKGNQYYSILGSMNLTKYSIENKYESVIVDHDSKKLYDHFIKLEQVGITLTNEMLEEYEEKYNKFNKELKPFIIDLEKKINIKPNEMQMAVLKELVELRSNGKNRALLYAATGTGKSYLSAFDLKRKGFKKALFIVHSRLIIKSAIRDYANVFANSNLLELKTNNTHMIKDSDIVFTTQNTINKIKETNKDFLSKFDYFIFDEAHKIGPQNEQGRILNEIKDRKDIFILAMSATPWRGDDPDYVVNEFDNNVVGNIDLGRAIEEKFVCDFEYSGVSVEIDFNQNTLSRNETEYMVEKFMEALKQKKVWDDTKVKGIIFTKNIEEADIVADIINEFYEYKAVAIHSKMNGDLTNQSSEEISTYIKRLQTEGNSLNFIVTVDMFNEGVDIPRINTIGMFRFTNSSIIYSQQIGRGLRKEGSNKKYLNIIDLVGNHENSFERIIGLTGKRTLNPKEIVDFVHELTELQMDKISKQKILKNITKKIKYKKYFDERIKYLNDYKSIIPKITEVEGYLKEDIQVIANNYRKNRHFLLGTKSWVESLYENTKLDLGEIPEIESGIIELFSWLPLTISTPREKSEILELIEGREILIDSKWHQYFYGKHDNNWRFVEGDYREYFLHREGYLKFKKDLIKSKGAIYLLGEIKRYLEENIDRNDHLRRTWYSKFEINFMAGRAERTMNANIKVLDAEDEVFIVNSIDKEYENRAISHNEYIVSTRGKKTYDPSYYYHNFMGKKVFHTNEMYLYVGGQSKPIEFNKYNLKEDGSEYSTCIFISKDNLTPTEYRYLTL